MKRAYVIKAGDKKLLLNGEPPKVNCMVVAEDNYNEILKAFKDIRDWDIKRYINGSGELLPQAIRKCIADFISQHD
jgi:hypothetical protein